MGNNLDEYADKLQNLLKIIDKAGKEVNALEAQLKVLYDQLHDTFNLKNVPEATKEIRKLEEEIKSKHDELEKKYEKLQLDLEQFEGQTKGLSGAKKLL